jgi:crotonobetainyl-CoA:carnitine CoA-transferase CaiB-like acyl-CoA transferase
MAAPLAGITVLDLGRVISGPLCALTLAELGATVIRVEKPGGDSSWQLPPFAHPDGSMDGTRRTEADIALSHLKRDHGKRSIEVDYTTPEGRDQLLALIARADVLVENFRPTVMSSLRLDYEVLRRVNPRIIHCSITGYGHGGPYQHRHGMAMLVAAMSGALGKTGFPDGPPVTPGFPVGDHVSAVYGVIGILAALRHRDQSGLGQFIDVSMYDVMVNMLWDEPLDQYQDESRADRLGNTDLRGAPINVYPTTDGWIAIMGLSTAHLTRLCVELDRPDLAAHDTLAARTAAAGEIDAAVTRWTSGRTIAEAMARLDAIDLPNAPVRSPWATRDDPHVDARAMLVSLEHAARPGTPLPYRAARLPLIMSAVELGASPVVEPLGASTAELVGATDDGSPGWLTGTPAADGGGHPVQ